MRKELGFQRKNRESTLTLLASLSHSQNEIGPEMFLPVLNQRTKDLYMIMAILIILFFLLNSSHQGFSQSRIKSCNNFTIEVNPRARFADEFNKQPQFQGVNLEKLVASYLPEIDTIEYTLKAEKAIKDPKAIIICLHGFDAYYSSALSMGRMLSYFAEAMPSNSKSDKKLRGDSNYLPIMAYSVELPGSAKITELENYEGLEQLSDFLNKYIDIIRARHPGLPVYVLTRNSSAAIAVEAHRINPVTFTPILMSPTLTGNSQTLELGLNGLLTSFNQDSSKENLPILNWVKKWLLEKKWSQESFAQGNFLILTGGQDLEMSNIEREFYRNLSLENSNVDYHESPNLGHNLLDMSAGIKALENEAACNFSIIFKFIRKSIVKSFMKSN